LLPASGEHLPLNRCEIRKALRVGITKNVLKMAYAFKLTTKQPIVGGKIPKGVSFQHVEQSSTAPQMSNVAKTIKAEFGFDVSSSAISSSYFEIKKL